MQISLVIPYYHSDDEKPGVLCGAVASMVQYADEVIIVSETADNLAAKINHGLTLATKEYIVCTNDDVVLTEGTLADLCSPDEVRTPLINNGTCKTFHGHAWGMHRDIYEQVGGMDESYQLYWMDVDYAMRLREMGIQCTQVQNVNMKHPDGARTLRHWAGKTENNDKDVFINKWGQEVYDPFRAQ